MFLKNYPECRAATLAEAQRKVDDNARGSTFEVAGNRDDVRFDVNVANFGDVTLLSASCNRATTMSWVAGSYMRQVFQVSGRSRLSFDRSSDPDASDGWLIPADTPLRIENDADYESLCMRIDSAALTSKLCALLGDDVDPPRFDHKAPVNGLYLRSLRLATLQMVSEIDKIGPRISRIAMAELTQTLIVKFLLCHPHNYSKRLSITSASPSHKQLMLLENYIAEHWDRPLDMEALARISNIGVRTIFRLFAQKRGDSPSRLMKKIRLDHARIMLMTGGKETSVLEVALKCGFQSFGHFAREYRQVFGELPLDTIRQNRSQN